MTIYLPSRPERDILKGFILIYSFLNIQLYFIGIETWNVKFEKKGIFGSSFVRKTFDTEF